jgi:hypothetical protein
MLPLCDQVMGPGQRCHCCIQQSKVCSLTAILPVALGQGHGSEDPCIPGEDVGGDDSVENNQGEVLEVDVDPGRYCAGCRGVVTAS